MHFLDNIEHFGTAPYADITVTVWLLILLALFFDFLNGFHDAANSVATVVSTRVLSPQMAVIWAAFFNFIAFMVFHLKVAATMGTGIIDPTIVDNKVIAATLIAACAWDLITWYWALPTSSSHALIGGMVGAALISTGVTALRWDGIGKTVVFIVLAPLIGMSIGLTIAVIVAWVFRRASPRRIDTGFRRGQLVSAALYSLGHGGNDAQKTMGIIFVLLIAASAAGSGTFTTKSPIPTEIVLACHVAMGLGTLFGGWRIVKTMGQRIIRLRPVDGFCAEAGAAGTLVMTIFGGIPVSTTHTITGSIIGVGMVKRMSAVRWAVAGRVVWAWVMTIPAAALIAAASWAILRAMEVS
ncbi:MAG: inorganic phosphate transporter [Gemmataceae bacterium]|nr:inorganic phosphate transporter [Gemmataceae bacterium]